VLDVAATRDPGGRRVVVAVVNRLPQEDVSVVLTVAGRRPSGEVLAHEINGDHPDAMCTFEDPGQVRVGERAARSTGIQSGTASLLTPSP
jgi:alpha-L-arabinofuranosidase